MNALDKPTCPCLRSQTTRPSFECTCSSRAKEGSKRRVVNTFHQTQKTQLNKVPQNNTNKSHLRRARMTTRVFLAALYRRTGAGSAGRAEATSAEVEASLMAQPHDTARTAPTCNSSLCILSTHGMLSSANRRPLNFLSWMTRVVIPRGEVSDKIRSLSPTMEMGNSVFALASMSIRNTRWEYVRGTPKQHSSGGMLLTLLEGL